ncbi:MAG TPA: MarR family transcriptional regulator [Pseudonocardiaceae bacterium]|nr:MarR family transcriptional regulator [Pseudonocardiaceae bacterium]
MTAFDKVFELAAVVSKVMHEALADRGLTPARAEVLFTLHQGGGPMVQRELSEALCCTPRHVTALIDTLESQGWVARGPHPTDRRATLVTLTEKGTAAAARMVTERQDAAQSLFGGLPTTQLAGFVAVADHVLQQFGNAPAAADAGSPGSGK